MLRLLCLLLLLTLPRSTDAFFPHGGIPATSGDPTSGILPAVNDAYANWTMAGMQSVGGIPLSRSTSCGTVSPRGSGLDDTAAIQAAINSGSCVAGDVLNLAAGTFTIGEGNTVLMTKGITLRGAGPCAGTAVTYPYPSTAQTSCTLIQRTNGCPPLSPSSNGNCGSNQVPFLVVGPEQFNNYVTSRNLAVDAAAGAYSVQVASATGFAVGQYVLLDELSNGAYQPDRGNPSVPTARVWASSDYRVQWAKHNAASPANGDDDFSSSQVPTDATSAGCWFNVGEAPSGTERCDRTTSEIKHISAINGTTITFDSPVTISYRTANTAQLSYYQLPFLTGAGVEGMTFSGADNGELWFVTSANSWAYNVECTQWRGECIQMNGSMRVEIRRFYVHDGAWPEPGGGGYAIALSSGSTETLVWDGISVRTNKVYVSQQSGAGSVVAYNFMDQAEICCNSTNPANGNDGWVENGLNNAHYPGSHHALFEGNLTHSMGEDDTHGNSIYNTYIRNWSQGIRLPTWVNAYDGGTIDDINASPQGTPFPRTPAQTQLYTYWESFIANVLGYSGYTNAAHGFTYLTTNGGPSIFGLGEGFQSGNNGPDVVAGFDTNGQGGTTIAHGNYDYLQNTVTWDPNISNHSIPSSFFVNSTPAFFSPGAGACSYPWPWVTPTGSSQVLTNTCGGSGLPAKARFDAGTPFAPPPYVGPGDLVAGASWWGGLRAYNAAYATGSNNAITVLRAIDSQTANIKILANGQLDTATAASFCASTTCTVTTIWDQTGGGHNVTQATPANQFILAFNCNGSQPCMQGNSSTPRCCYASVTNAVTVGTGYPSMAMVADPNGASVGALLEIRDQLFNFSFSDVGGTQCHMYGLLFLQASCSNNTWHSALGVFGPSAIATIDGTDTTGNTGSTPSSSVATVGVGWNGGVEPFDGSFEEVGAWGSYAFTSSDRTKLCHNQRLYWGTAGSC